MINRFTFLILFLSFSLTSIYADNLLEISSDNQLPDFLSNKVIVEGENNSLDNISTDDELLSDPGIKEVNELIEYNKARNLDSNVLEQIEFVSENQVEEELIFV